MPPLVSVVTPTYNAEAFIAETVESVLAQTHDHVEHILVDDASEDGTRAILDDYAHRYPGRVRVRSGRSRTGPIARRNEALAEARGEFVAWLDHDDVWAPSKLALQVAALQATPAAVLSFTQYEEFEHDTGATIFRSQLRNGSDLLDRLFGEGCFVASSTVVFRRAPTVERDPPLRAKHFSFGDDYELWLTLLLVGRGVLVDDHLVRLRRHDANESSRLSGVNYHELRVELLREFLAENPGAKSRLTRPVVAASLARHTVAAAVWELEHGRRLRAIRAALRAAAYDPRGATSYLGRTIRRARTKWRRERTAAG